MLLVNYIHPKSTLGVRKVVVRKLILVSPTSKVTTITIIVAKRNNQLGKVG
ncbi:hypothetical protein D3C73_1436190 [compost metagenome]